MGMRLTQKHKSREGFRRRSEMSVDSRREGKYFLFYFNENGSFGRAGCVKNLVVLKDKVEEAFKSYKV